MRKEELVINRPGSPYLKEFQRRRRSYPKGQSVNSYLKDFAFKLKRRPKKAPSFPA